MNTIVTETTEFGEVPIDIYQKLSNNRILFLNDQISDKLASDFCATLILKDNENSTEKVTIFINSDGGDIRSTLMMYDVMRIVSCPLETICTGFATDEAALILIAGSPGSRFATKNSVIAVGQLSHMGSAHGDLINAKKYLEQSLRDNNRMMEIISKHSGKSLTDTINKYKETVFMTAASAVKNGIIDKVINSNK